MNAIERHAFGDPIRQVLAFPSRPPPRVRKVAGPPTRTLRPERPRSATPHGRKVRDPLNGYERRYARAMRVARGLRGCLVRLSCCALVGCGEPATTIAPEPAPPRALLRVDSLNTWGVPGAESLVERFARLPQALRARDPDVIALQEVWLPSSRRTLADALAPRHTIADAVGGGLLIAARHPMRDALFHPFPEFDGLTLVERLAGKGWLEVVVEAPHGPVRVVTTHLAFRGPVEQQAAALFDALADRTDLPLVVAGDFNLAPDHALWEEAARRGLRLVGATRRVMDGSLVLGAFTREGWPRRHGPFARGWRPDHVLARGLVPWAHGVSWDTPETALSDHNLVWVEFDLASTP